MAITPTSAATSLQASSISQQDFFKLLVTQLSFQDPLKPIDNEAFIAQIAQFTSLEQTRQMNDRLNSLLTIQSATQAIGLIGRTVEVATATGSVVGTVTTLSFDSGTPFLSVLTSAGQVLSGIGLDKINLVRS
ncbi:MAG: flagellar hook capping protein [Burkholderiales bacterium]|nr:flagellar hook capping protein [Burkholderiales bacterium]